MERTSQQDQVDFVVTVPLPSMIQEQAISYGKKLVERCTSRFDNVRLHMHLKSEGSQVACNLTLYTDDGRYHATSKDWDIRQAVLDAVSTVEFQVDKRVGKRSAHMAVA